MDVDAIGGAAGSGAGQGRDRVKEPSPRRIDAAPQSGAMSWTQLQRPALRKRLNRSAVRPADAVVTGRSTAGAGADVGARAHWRIGASIAGDAEIAGLRRGQGRSARQCREARCSAPARRWAAGRGRLRRRGRCAAPSGRLARWVITGQMRGGAMPASAARGHRRIARSCRPRNRSRPAAISRRGLGAVVHPDDGRRGLTLVVGQRDKGEGAARGKVRSRHCRAGSGG